MSRPILRFTLFPQLLLAMGVAIALPLTGLWYFGHYQYQQLIDRQTNAHFSHIVDTLAVELEAWEEMNTRLLEQLSRSVSIGAGSAENIQATAHRNTLLASVSSTYEWIYLAYIIDSNGYMSARSDASHRPLYDSDGRPVHFRGDRDYHQQIMSGSRWSRELLINRTHNKPALIRCIRLQGQKGAISSLCVAMTVEAISRTIADVALGATGHVILVDQYRRIIAHGDANRLSNQLENLSDMALIRQAIANKPYVFIDEGGVQKVAYQKNTINGWTLFVEQDYHDAFSLLSQSRHRSLLFLLLAITACGVIAFLMARRLSHPIRQITRLANHVSRGDNSFELTHEGFGNDEIGELKEAIERMRVTIKLAMERLGR